MQEVRNASPKAARRAVLACLALAASAWSDVAAAETFASGPGPLQATSETAAINQIVCYVGNFGTTAVTVQSAQVQNDRGQARPLFVDTCRTTIAANRICVIAARVNALTEPSGTVAAFRCRFEVSAKADLRGTMNVRTDAAQPQTLYRLDMR